MIFVDTNFFVRAFVSPSTHRDRQMNSEADALFAAVEQGQREITTSDAIVAEVVYVMTSPNLYARSRTEVVDLLLPILSLRGCRLPDKPVTLRALDFYQTAGRLSFVDALAAAHCERPGMELATFDGGLHHLPGIVRYDPPKMQANNGHHQ